MAVSKFDGIFDAAAVSAPPPVEQQQSPPAAHREKRQMTQTKQPTRQAGPGRPPGGKSSNPEWQQTTVQLKRATKQAAQAILITHEGQDLSEVLQELLEQWVKKQ